MYISQPCKTWLLTTSCALVLLSGGALCHAQAADPQNADSIDYLYVSPQGNDAWSGQSPTASSVGGPFQTLAHAQEAVTALADPGLSRPVEVVFDAGVCSSQDFLTQWFTSAPVNPVIWHSDLSRTVLIYTRTMAEQNDALGAEDYSNASGTPITRYYVSPTGSDDSSGLYPSSDADNGPFLSLGRAQEAVFALHTESPNAPVEVVIESGFAGSSTFLDAAVGKNAHKPVKHTAAANSSKKSASGAKPMANKITPKAMLGASAIKNATATGTDPKAKLVFAHYMVCNRDYGGSVAGYERDIQEAQAAGVDGFALNVGWWSGANYKRDTASIFQAAQALGTGFKLFFSVDEGGSNLTNQGMPAADILDMMQTYGNDPSYFHYLTRPVLSTWGGEGTVQITDSQTAAQLKPSQVTGLDFWLNQVLTPLRNTGMNPFFIPEFQPKYVTPTWQVIQPNASVAQIQGDYNLWWNQVVDGLFYAEIGAPTSPASQGLINQRAFGAVSKANNKLFMSSVSPQYWQNIISGRSYVEYNGGEGLTNQWSDIINVQKPNWVELFTWNDFDESTYFSPIDDVCKYWPYLTGHRTLGFYKSHAGELALTKYYILWYKTGVKPAATHDTIYFFYRTQPANMIATSDARGPVSTGDSSVQDTIYITTSLSAAATLNVTSGTTLKTFPVPAGNSSIRVPFQVGSQTFSLSRKGKLLLTKQGEPIVDDAPEYNYNYYTGTASN